METDFSTGPGNVLSTGPGRPKGFDDAQALDAAIAVFWDKGYEAASVGDLLQAAGISRSSFYEAFGSKRDLLLAAIRHYCTVNRAKAADIIEDADTPRKAIRETLAFVANGGGEKGCLLVNCITELAPHDDEVRSIAQDHGERLEQILAGLILRERGGEPKPADTVKARSLISLAYGATLMRKSGMDGDTVRTLLRTGEAILE